MGAGIHDHRCGTCYSVGVEGVSWNETQRCVNKTEMGIGMKYTFEEFGAWYAALARNFAKGVKQ